MRRFKTISKIVAAAMVEFYASENFDELSKIIKRLKENKAPIEILESISRIRNLKSEKVSKCKIIKEIRFVKPESIIEFLINTLLKKQVIRRTCPDRSWKEITRMYYNLIPFMKNPINFEEFCFYVNTIFMEAFQESLRRLKQK